MKKYFVALLHIGFWACYLLAILIIVTIAYRNSAMSEREFRMVNALQNLLFFALFPSIITFHLFYFFLFPSYIQQNKFFLSFVYGIAIAIAAAALGYLFLRMLIESGWMMDMDQGGKQGRSTAVIVITSMTLIGMICGIVALIMRGFITWFSEIKVKQMLREKNYEMEMALIKSQLDPHLLFNTINNIDALILRDAVKASDYLNRLSDIMRFVLYETRANKILLSQEIEYIEKYIGLQKIRTANESYVQWSVSGTIGNKMIAPMVFIPFIENAFKHTTNKKLENAITIRVLITEVSIELICENRFESGSIRQAVGGLGNELVQKRLDLIYAGTHLLEIKKSDDLYRVHLTIPHG
ncbi:MAG: sensor histidine kinase [Cyclobacteriaceae bacterium]|nr:sensor histidine kinase [Cyclobacteriaceae bacterium]